MQNSKRSRRTACGSAFAFAALLGSILLAAAAPASAATPISGAWIFPHAKRTAAVADALDDTFYTGDSENAWLQNSFFADSAPDGATVAVDLYNPTGEDLYNVQIFAAYPVEELDLVSSISFSGGASGDLSYAGADLASGGTPTLPGGGSSMDAHDIYPTYFVSYGFGDLAAGSSTIGSFTIEVEGDFASGLMVHLDYTAEDADGGPVSGPFEADMNIFENGESEEPCDADVVPFSIEVNYFENTAPSMSVHIAFRVVELGAVSDARLSARFSAGQTPTEADQGSISDGIWQMLIPKMLEGEVRDINLSVEVWSDLIDGDAVSTDAGAEWTACDGTTHRTHSPGSSEVEVKSTGLVKAAVWWDSQAEKTKKGDKKAEFNRTEFAVLLQRVAAHSDVFIYAAWNGTTPEGFDDEGWVDIDSLSEALAVLSKKTDESKRVRGAEREALALWLNIASGAVNLDQTLEVVKKKGRGSEFADHTGLNTLPSGYDTPGEVLSFLESQINDWQDGSGASKGDLKLARRLARAVSSEWLVPA